MNQGMLSRHEEFGGTAWLALPGQDPALVRDLIDGFTEHMGPVNVIERLWVRDIAILTARIEFLRKAQWAAVAWFTEQAAAEATGQQQGSATELDAAAVRELLLQQQEGETASQDSRLHRLLGKAVAGQLGLFAQMLETEVTLLTERNSMLVTFEGERRNQVKEAIELLERTGFLGPGRQIQPPADMAEAGGDAAAA